MDEALITRRFFQLLRRIEDLEDSVAAFGIDVVSNLTPCQTCGQIEEGQEGTDPCQTCGVPRHHFTQAEPETLADIAATDY